VLVAPSAAGEGGADGAADRGDLVLGLEHAHVGITIATELLHHLGRRGDRIAAQEQRQPGAPGGLHQALGECGIAADEAIDAGAALTRVDGHPQRADEILCRLAVVPAGVKGVMVGFGQFRRGGEALCDPLIDARPWP